MWPENGKKPKIKSIPKLKKSFVEDKKIKLRYNTKTSIEKKMWNKGKALGQKITNKKRKSNANYHREN